MAVKLITSQKQLDETRDSVKFLTEKLNDTLKSRIVYSDGTKDDREYRPLFVINELAERTLIRREIKKINDLNESVRNFTGKSTTQLPVPILVEDVAHVRVFKNKSISSRKATSSRLDVVASIESRLRTLNRQNYGNSKKPEITRLKKELAWFKKDKEEVYRIRSFPVPDLISHIYLDSGKKIRERVKVGGVYLFNKDQIKVTTPELAAPRKRRPSLFDNIEPVPYSGMFAASLYRESEVIREKERIGFSQSNTDHKMRKEQKRASSTA